VDEVEEVRKGSRILGVKGSRGKDKTARGRGFEGKEKKKAKGSRENAKGWGMLKNFKELKVWQKAYNLSLEIYKITKNFPNEEKYGLSSQMRRAAVSIPSNISEGYGRRTTPDYIRSLYIAYGSNCELETQTLLSGDLAYIENEKQKTVLEKISEVERMLKALIKSLESRS
jgi:four helix bundle protein